MIMFPTVSKAQARQAARFASKAGWTGRDVAEAMGWGYSKALRVVRIYQQYGEEAFGL